MFRPQTVIIRPYNNMSHYKLYYQKHESISAIYILGTHMFTLKRIKMTEGSEYNLLRICLPETGRSQRRPVSGRQTLT
jgi:hypothetical protein